MRKKWRDLGIMKWGRENMVIWKNRLDIFLGRTRHVADHVVLGDFNVSQDSAHESR